MKGSRAEATVFLGGGRITSALIAGLRSSGYEQPIVVHDRDAQKLGHLKRQYSVTIEHDLRRAVDQAHLLIIAVRPDGISRLLDAIGSVKRPITAISLAAGVPLAKLRASLRPPVRWVRAMPSPVCRSGRGLTAVTFESAVSPGGRRGVEQLFERGGQGVKNPEREVGAFTVTHLNSHGSHAPGGVGGGSRETG